MFLKAILLILRVRQDIRPLNIEILFRSEKRHKDPSQLKVRLVRRSVIRVGHGKGSYFPTGHPSHANLTGVPPFLRIMGGRSRWQDPRNTCNGPSLMESALEVQARCPRAGFEDSGHGIGSVTRRRD